MRRFLADASHELRTPVAALQASAETLLREQPERPERDLLEARLARDAARLGRLVDDLLNLARLEANEPLRREAVDLATLAAQAADESRARSNGVSITTELTPGAPVQGDPDALSRVLRNLLDNALTAVGPGGSVRVTLGRDDRYAQAYVWDDGPGVPEEARQRVFERFVRLDGGSGPGTGLGLAIAQRIARQHGGDVVCEPVDRGACFVLRVPLVAR
jgi:signal transduction histidine kinase